MNPTVTEIAILMTLRCVVRVTLLGTWTATEERDRSAWPGRWSGEQTSAKQTA